MRRFSICILVLLAMITGSLWNASAVRDTADEINDCLTRAEEAVAQEDWHSASLLTRQAYDTWQSRQTWLEVTLRLDDTDEVDTEFREVLSYLQWQDAPEYACANSQLKAFVEHLAETEALNWRSVL